MNPSLLASTKQREQQEQEQRPQYHRAMPSDDSLGLDFSVYIRTVPERELEKELVDLMTLSICSTVPPSESGLQQTTWLVTSNEEPLENECPFVERLQEEQTALLSLQYRQTTTILWNTPEVVFSKNAFLEEPSESYYVVNVRWPVYQWGGYVNEDDNIVYLQQWFQAHLESRIRSEEIDVIVVQGMDISVVGEESITFNTQADFLPGIPVQAAQALQTIGGAFLIFNTMIVIIITFLGNRQFKRRWALAQQEQQLYGQGGESKHGGEKSSSSNHMMLVSPQGVDEMLQTTRRLVSNENRLVKKVHASPSAKPKKPQNRSPSPSAGSVGGGLVYFDTQLLVTKQQEEFEDENDEEKQQKNYISNSVSSTSPSSSGVAASPQSLLGGSSAEETVDHDANAESSLVSGSLGGKSINSEEQIGSGDMQSDLEDIVSGEGTTSLLGVGRVSFDDDDDDIEDDIDDAVDASGTGKKDDPIVLDENRIAGVISYEKELLGVKNVGDESNGEQEDALYSFTRRARNFQP